jgi:hypothetical protein
MSQLWWQAYQKLDENVKMEGGDVEMCIAAQAQSFRTFG